MVAEAEDNANLNSRAAAAQHLADVLGSQIMQAALDLAATQPDLDLSDPAAGADFNEVVITGLQIALYRQIDTWQLPSPGTIGENEIQIIIYGAR